MTRDKHTIAIVTTDEHHCILIYAHIWATTYLVVKQLNLDLLQTAI